MSRTPMNRREFAAEVAVAATAASFLVAPLEAPNASAQENNEKSKEPKKNDPDADEPKSPAELLTEVVQQRYPDERLTAEVLSKIQSDIQADLSRSRALSSYPLKNSDEPAFVFAAYRSDAPK